MGLRCREESLNTNCHALCSLASQLLQVLHKTILGGFGNRGILVAKLKSKLCEGFVLEDAADDEAALLVGQMIEAILDEEESVLFGDVIIVIKESGSGFDFRFDGNAVVVV